MGSEIKQSLTTPVYVIFWLAVILAFFAIIKSALMRPEIFKTNKPIYLLRLLIFPFVAFSFAASCILTIMHGVEYVCVFNKMNSRSNQPESNRMQVLITAVILLFIYGLLVFWVESKKSILPNGEVQIIEPTAQFFSILTIGLVYTHYYLDRIIFRMRDPVTRELVGPLLVSPSSNI